MRYQRTDLSSAVRAAQHSASVDGLSRYVYATAYGWTVQLEPAPFGRRCLSVQPDGTTQEKSC